jgi:hypothetical protein
LKVKGRKMTEDEAQGLQRKWMAKFGRGGNQYRSVAVLDEQAEYESIGSKLNEAGLGEITEMAQAEICGVFGVPPILVGAFVGLKYVNQRASVREAQADFWDNTISPQLRAWREFLTWSLLPMFEPIDQIAAGRVRVNWDISQVAAMQEDEDKAHDRARKDYAAGLTTLNEGRAKIGLDAAADDQLGESFIAVPILDPEQTQSPASPKRFIDPARNAKLNGTRQHSILFNPEKKTFEIDGVTLSREPTELEAAVLDLKAIAGGAAKEAAKLGAVLKDLREDLIAEAVRQFGELPADRLYELILTPPRGYEKRVARIISQSVERGKNLVAAELRRQGADIDLAQITIDLKAITEKLTDLTISRSVATMQSRTTSQIAEQGILGTTPDAVGQMLGAILETQSDKWTDEFAAAGVNSAVSDGREQTMRQLDEQIAYYEYSAIMDRNVCEPCAEWDTTQTEDLDELPSVPNDGCEGGDRCRCLIIAIFKEPDDAEKSMTVEATKSGGERVCIIGYPGTGKTTLANELGGGRSTDDLINLGWSAASDAASYWFDDPGPWVIEGVAVPRALRKWSRRHPGEPPPVDRVIRLTRRYRDLEPGAVAMGVGMDTVIRSILPWLEAATIDVR